MTLKEIKSAILAHADERRTYATVHFNELHDWVYGIQAYLERAEAAEASVRSLESDRTALKEAYATLCRAINMQSGALSTLRAEQAHLRKLVENWRWMAMAGQTNMVPGDEAGAISRWTAVEMCADELSALLVSQGPQGKEG